MVNEQNIPIVLLLGASSSSSSLPNVPIELSDIHDLLSSEENQSPRFRLKPHYSFDSTKLYEYLGSYQSEVAILHFSGHSNDSAWIGDVKDIAPDERIYSRHIAKHIENWGKRPSLVFLNGCENSSQVKQFHEAEVPIVIATHRAVSDDTAREFATAFYKLLFSDKCLSIETAFDQAGSAIQQNQGVDFSPRRCFSLDKLDERGSGELGWGIYPLEKEYLAWTKADVISNDRPVFDKRGLLVNPYKGLDAFEENDKAWFFGREEVSEELIEAIPKTPLYTLIGASGSGKSSLTQAGVIPVLRAQEEYLILTTQPGGMPFKELADVILPVLYPDPIEQAEKREGNDKEKSFSEKLASSDNDTQRVLLKGLIAPLLQKSNQKRLLLFIDQFEELFTQSRLRGDLIERYLNQLVLLIKENDSCSLVINLRADFLPSLIVHREFNDLLNRLPHKFLSSMSSHEIRNAIEHPAKIQRIKLADGLVTDLVGDIEKQPGGLPLLQYVLEMLWNQRSGREVKSNIDGREFRGLKEAFQQYADEVFDTFDPAEKEMCKRIFINLIELGDGTKDTRRRAYLKNFSGAERLIIKDLADARLLTTSQLLSDGEVLLEEDVYVEVAHEVLIEEWKQIQSWLFGKRDGIRLMHEIRREAIKWKTILVEHKEERARDVLRRGTQLEIANAWKKSYSELVIKVDEEFLSACNAATAEEEGQQEKAAKIRRMLTLMLGVTALIMFTALLYALFVNNENERTLEERKVALEEKETALKDARYWNRKVIAQASEGALENGKILEHISQSDAVIANRNSLIYLLEAQKADTNLGKKVVGEELLTHVASIDESILNTPSFEIFSSASARGLSLDPFRSVAALGDRDGKITLISLETGERLKSWDTGSAVSSLVYHPKKKDILFSGNIYGDIQFWNTQTAREIIPKVNAHGKMITALAISPDGEAIASASMDLQIRRWKPSSGAQIGKPLIWQPWGVMNVDAPAYVNDLAYGPDGNSIAAGYEDGKVRIWDPVSGLQVALPPSEYTSAVRSVVYISDTIVATGSDDGALRLWDVRTIKQIQAPLKDKGIGVTSLAYDKEMNKLALGTYWGEVELWDIASGKLDNVFFPRDRFRKRTSDILALAFDPDRNRILASSTEKKIRFWDTQTKLPRSLIGHKGLIEKLVYSQNGLLLASSSNDNEIRFWSTNTRSQLHDPIKTPSPIEALAHHPRKNIIVSGLENGELHFWNTDLAIKSREPIKMRSSAVSSLAFHPTLDILAVGFKNGVIEILNMNDGKLLAPTLMRHKYKITALAFHPEKNLVGSASDDGSLLGDDSENIKIWNYKTGRIEKSFRHSDVITLQFQNSGDLLVSTDQGGTTVWKWPNYNFHHEFDLPEAKLAYKPGENYKPSPVVMVINDPLKTSKFMARKSRTQPAVLFLYNIHTEKMVFKKEFTGNAGLISVARFSPGGKSIAVGVGRNIEIFDFGHLSAIVHDFEPNSVLKGLKFLWEFEFDGIDTVVSKRQLEADDNKTLLTLLEMPLPGENKIGHLIRWLEGQCAYNNQERKADCIESK